MSVIFLAGAHAVGKSFLGKPAAEALGLIHCSASQLIREEKGRATWDSAKRVEEIDDNQKTLIRAIERKRSEGQRLLIDGHFVLRDSSGAIVQIEANVFDAMKLDGVVLLEENPAVVLNRLRARDDHLTSLADVTHIADAERSHALVVTTRLHIPLTTIMNPTLAALTEAIARLFSARENAEY